MDATKIDRVLEIVGRNRVDGDPIVSGKWIVWRCGMSGMTMAKFVARCKAAGFPAFHAGGKFGVLAESVA